MTATEGGSLGYCDSASENVRPTGAVAGRCARRVAAWWWCVWFVHAAGGGVGAGLDLDGPGLMARWFDDCIPSEQAYIAAQRPHERADLVVSGTEER